MRTYDMLLKYFFPNVSCTVCTCGCESFVPRGKFTKK